MRFLENMGYKVSYKGQSGWFKAYIDNTEASVWTIERMGMLEMMSALNVIIAYSIKDMGDSDPTSPTFIFAATSKNMYSQLVKSHPNFMDAVRLAEQSSVFVAFVDHSLHTIDDPVEVLNLSVP
ncbi:hypothetical protein IA64_07530 [Xanthomonas arboricola pv. celebensis]|nr:hypothetical protein IA64_07530 [Xanthomonas arboricola pv. celebensis]